MSLERVVNSLVAVSGGDTITVDSGAACFVSKYDCSSLVALGRLDYSIDGILVWLGLKPDNFLRFCLKLQFEFRIFTHICALVPHTSQLVY